MMYNTRPLAAVVLLFLSLTAASDDTDVNIAIIVHPDVGQESISTQDLEQILVGNKRFWDGGKSITILIQAPVSRERDIVIGKLMKMSESQYRQFWISKVFRTEVASGPKVVLSNEMAASLIGRIPGAMAFARDDEIPKGVKVLKVDGLYPGEDGYPLQY